MYYGLRLNAENVFEDSVTAGLISNISPTALPQKISSFVYCFLCNQLCSFCGIGTNADTFSLLS